MITGIYGIFVGAKLVYIGKSRNMVERRSQHWSNIYAADGGRQVEDKYLCLAAARKAHFTISFKIIKVCDFDELDDLERNYIKTYHPYLNTVYNEGKVISVDTFLSLMNSQLSPAEWLTIDNKVVGEFDDIPSRMEELKNKDKIEKQIEENKITRLEAKVDLLLEMTAKILERLEDAA